MTVRVSDANILAWRDLDFEDGAGRGTVEDWLASGCWPDAADAPILAVVGDDAYYAHRGVVRRLPPVSDAPKGALWSDGIAKWSPSWPVMWHDSIDARWMLWVACTVLPRDQATFALCAFARTACRFIPIAETRCEMALVAAERCVAGTGSLDDVASAIEEAKAAARALAPSPAAHHAALAAVRAAASFLGGARLLNADVVARYVVEAFERGTTLTNKDCHRLTAYLLRGVLPWHAVLACLLKAPSAG